MRTMKPAAHRRKVPKPIGHLFSIATAKLEDAALWAAECQSPRRNKKSLGIRIRQIVAALADVQTLMDSAVLVTKSREASNSAGKRRKTW